MLLHSCVPTTYVVLDSIKTSDVAALLCTYDLCCVRKLHSCVPTTYVVLDSIKALDVDVVVLFV